MSYVTAPEDPPSDRPSLSNNTQIPLSQTLRTILIALTIYYLLGILVSLLVVYVPSVATLAQQLISREIYIDERALLVNAAQATVRPSTIQRWIKEQQNHFHLNGIQLPTQNTTDLRTIVELFENARFDSISYYEHTHPSFSPFAGCKSTQMIAGRILAHHGDGKESLVMVVNRYESLSLLLYLSEHLTTVKFLAKDILLIYIHSSSPCPLDEAISVPKHIHDGRAQEVLLAWLAEYVHGKSSDIILPPDLRNSSLSTRFIRSGVIIGALVIDSSLSSSMQAFTVLSLSSGVAPNLDIIGVVAITLSSHRVPVTVNGMSQLSSTLQAGIEHSFQSSFNQPLHSPFLQFGIDAVTIRTIPEYNHQAPLSEPKAFALMACIENVFRSLNNLIERLHHSTWLYLIVSPTVFITFKDYVLGYAYLSAPLPLISFFIFMRYSFPNLGSSLWLIMSIYCCWCIPIITSSLMSTAFFSYRFRFLFFLMVPIVFAIILSSWIISRVFKKHSLSMDLSTTYALHLIFLFLSICPYALLHFWLSLCLSVISAFIVVISTCFILAPSPTANLSFIRAIIVAAIGFLVSPITLVYLSSSILDMSMSSFIYLTYINSATVSLSVKWLFFGIYFPSYTILLLHALQFACSPKIVKELEGKLH